MLPFRRKGWLELRMWESASLDYDWVDITLSGVGSGAALVSVGAKDPRIKLISGSVGFAATVGGVINSVYKYQHGQLSLRQLQTDVALDVTPMFGKTIAGRSGKAVIDIVDHQIGVGQVLKSIIYDPHKKQGN